MDVRDEVRAKEDTAEHAETFGRQIVPRRKEGSMTRVEQGREDGGASTEES